MASTEDFTTLTAVSAILTKEFLSKALSEWFSEDISFTHWENVSNTEEGESYLSDLMRIKICGTNKNSQSKIVQVILKTIPKNTCRRLTYRSEEFFKNEITFYKTVLPELLKFQSSKNLKDPYNGYVKVFLSHFDETNAVICLEDATLEGYNGVVRQQGIDFEHCSTAFKSLAQFHAISIAMKDQQPEEFDKLKNSVFETYYGDRLWGWYEKFWLRICDIAIDAVEKEFPNSIYEKKIKEFAVPERYKNMIRAVNTHDEGVISHGDTWVTNFLYKYKNDKPVDSKIIDFQLTRCATPVLDLSFFIYSCTDQRLRSERYDDLISQYYAVLSKQVRDMGSDPDKLYSWEKFTEDLKKYSYFGLGFSFESMPFTVLSKDDCFNMNLEGDEKRNIADFWLVKPYKTKEARLRAAHNVVFCVDKQYI